MLNITNLIVVAEPVEKSEYDDKVIGWICGCPKCYTPSEYSDGEWSRPQCMLTGFDGTYGNIKVYADTLELYNKEE